MYGFSQASARYIRDARPEFVRNFGGEEDIPEYDDGHLSLDETIDRDDQQQTLETSTD